MGLWLSPNERLSFIFRRYLLGGSVRALCGMDFFRYHVGVLLATSYCSRRSLVLPRQRSEGHFAEFRSQSD